MRLSPAQERAMARFFGGEIAHRNNYQRRPYWSSGMDSLRTETLVSLMNKGLIERSSMGTNSWIFTLTPTGLEALKEYQRNVK